MTRFSISLDEGVDLVLWAMRQAQGGEVFVPKIPSYRVTDLATAIGPNCRKEVIGIRPGEKIHEELITANDSYTTLDLGKYYAILGGMSKTTWPEYGSTTKVDPGFSYNSRDNQQFLTVDQLRALIRGHVDSHFQPV